MKQVLKYHLPVGPSLMLQGEPVFAGVKANELNGYANLWIETPNTIDDPVYEYRIFGTGHSIDAEWRHFQSFTDGPHVWHVYRRLAS